MKWLGVVVMLWLLARLGGLLMLVVMAGGDGVGPGVEWLLRVPLDVVLLAVLLLWLPPRRVVLVSIAAMLMLAVTLSLAEGATFAIFGRELNVWLDASLLSAGYQLLTSNLGNLPALLVVAVMVSGLAGLVWVVSRGLGGACAASARTPRLRRLWLSVGMMGLAGVSLGAGYLRDAPRPGIDFPLASVVVEQAEQLPRTLAARRRFEQRQRRQQPEVTPLPGLQGRDVVLIFIESYGMSLLEEDAASLRDTLKQASYSLADQGIASVSGRLRSPVRGGQSWLAHASVLSGLTIDDGLDYRLLLKSRRGSMVQDFAATGHHTLALMPAITQAWPEGRAYGFDTLVDAGGMGYAGPSLHWVTMPDQYSLKTLATRWLDSQDAPVFAQVALISSHAPWTPILPVRDWAAIGDGSGFRRWADAGPEPEVLWRDMDEVRRHYAEAVRYSLRVTLAWVERYLDDDGLVMVMGDHPAAPVVTGPGASPDVPVHLFSRDAELVAPFLEHGFRDGLIPAATPASSTMACWRHWLQRYFADGEDETESAVIPRHGALPACQWQPGE
ncbi:alkaline phosphatase [Halomonas elongata]|uniref:alkaline phosphatase n=1 Tax=Halomonas elongata TaxID=2746 RepID=UPI0023B0E113|nr:alkaline phosphatase [Halomonas elongata]